MTGVIGIDESNNHRIPEIFVARYSPNPQSVRGGRYYHKIDDFMEAASRLLRPYSFIVFEQRDIEKMGNYERVQAAAIVEFVKHYAQCGDLERAVMDGGRFPEVNECVRLWLPDNRVKIDYVKRGDEKLQLVNDADALARFFYRVSRGEIGNLTLDMFEDHRLRVELSSYVHSFPQPTYRQVEVFENVHS